MDLPLDQRIARNNRIETRLLLLAGLFMIFFATALSISRAVLMRGADAPLLWQHWVGVLVWLIVFLSAVNAARHWLPVHDPYLLPAAGLLIGWGLLTIWSLRPEFGLRQTVWLAVAGLLLITGFRLATDLRFLRRYKYLWLTAGLLLTGLTLLIGVNPLGYGPRMWLSLLGLYFQPSEPLKLLLVAYLAAYLADQNKLVTLVKSPPGDKNGFATDHNRPHNWAAPFLPLVAPILIMMVVAVALLGAQRDLGTAAVLLFLFAVLIYVATGRRRVVAFAGLGFLIAGFFGYLVFDVVRVRVDAWLNPWADPSGGSYQIVQSLMAVANGGIVGRGPGLGSPVLVPVAHSDLIFAAVAEQNGLAGVIGMLVLMALIAGRGLLISLENRDPYKRFLATGLTAYLAGQSLLIIGGTLRLFPLTGVTLPFVSYGGSSLVVSVLSLLLLLLISRPTTDELHVPVDHLDTHPNINIGLAIGVGITLAALLAGWWAVVRSPELLSRTDNPRRAVSDRYVRRGAILDRNGAPISVSEGLSGSYVRRMLYPPLSNIVGYTSPTYGQSGLEASLDPYLRGLEGNLQLRVIWNHLVYGQPPPGLDVRLALDLELQTKADRLMGGQSGALVLLNPDTGEILAIASHPTFDANKLGADWDQLVKDPRSPLLDRALLGRYPVGALDGLFPEGLAGLKVAPTPALRLPTGDRPVDDLQPTALQSGYSPLQMALAAATVSAGGVRPAPQLATALKIPAEGWTPLPPLSNSTRVLAIESASMIAKETGVPVGDFWQVVKVVEQAGNSPVTWYLGGVNPSDISTSIAPAARLAIAVVLEADNPGLAQQIGQAFLAQLH